MGVQIETDIVFFNSKLLCSKLEKNMQLTGNKLPVNKILFGVNVKKIGLHKLNTILFFELEIIL